MENSKKSTAEHEVRLSKVAQLAHLGIESWSEHREVSSTCEKALEGFSLETDLEKEHKLAGRLVAIREHGKTIFAHMLDVSGKLQLYIKHDVLGDELFNRFKQFFDVGDIVWCRGTLFVTKKGETTFRVQEISLLSKCLHPLPEKFHGLADVEVRYRQRYLDLISNTESRAKFVQRSKIIQSVRSNLLDEQFLEVETPMLHSMAGGAAARPFVTHHNAYDMELFLRIAPELYLKRLVIGGFERVFEINRNFRNEGVSTRHNPEFTMLELYMAHGDYKDGMAFTEQLLHRVAADTMDEQAVVFKDQHIDFSKPFRRLSLFDSLVEVGGFSKEQLERDAIDTRITEHAIKLTNKNASYGEKLFALFEERVEHQLLEPTFIIGHPIETSPLAKRNPSDPYSVCRFELFIGGMELANGFSELNDPIDQAERFKMQLEAARSGDKEAHDYDAEYIRALEYGLPPTVGVGIGIDRLVMLITQTVSIKDVILFPTMKRLSEN